MPQHPYELLSTYLLVKVDVHLLHYTLELVLIGISEELPQLVYVDETGVILNDGCPYRIEELEGLQQSFFSEKLVCLVGSHHKFSKVRLPRTVGVEVVENALNGLILDDLVE